MHARRRPAQATVEFALVLPALMLVLAGTMAFGQVFFNYAQLLQAAQEGARYGAVLPYTRNDTAIRNRVQQVAPGGTSDTVTISATTSPTNSSAVSTSNRTRGNVLTVQVQHAQPIAIPFFPVSSYTLSASSSMVIEVTP